MTSSENAHETERPIDIDEFSDAKVYSTPVQKSLDEIMKIDNEDGYHKISIQFLNFLILESLRR